MTKPAPSETCGRCGYPEGHRPSCGLLRERRIADNHPNMGDLQLLAAEAGVKGVVDEVCVEDKAVVMQYKDGKASKAYPDGAPMSVTVCRSMARELAKTNPLETYFVVVVERAP